MAESVMSDKGSARPALVGLTTIPVWYDYGLTWNGGRKTLECQKKLKDLGITGMTFERKKTFDIDVLTGRWFGGAVIVLFFRPRPGYRPFPNAIIRVAVASGAVPWVSL